MSVECVHCTSDVLHRLEQKKFDLIILDIMKPHGETFTEFETQGGFTTGQALAKRIRELYPQTKVIAFTQWRNAQIENWFSQQEGFAFVHKGGDLWGTIKGLLGIVEPPPPPPTVFIVHGRDSITLSSVRSFLQEHGVRKVVVLADKPSKGLTIIEKFERYAKQSDIAVVLFTPDDRGYLIEKPHYATDRARMNVILEYGYFLAQLGRTGRVILLRKGDVDIPTDISGIVYIDITDGVEQAGPRILAEILESLTTEPNE